MALIVFSVSPALAQEKSKLQWIKSPFIDFVGTDVAQLQSLELSSQELIEGCISSLDWPDSFPKPLTVILSGVTDPVVSTGVSGIVRVEINAASSGEVQAEWMLRGLLAHFAAWKGIRTPPPDWLIRSIHLRGAIRYKPQVRVLLLRQLQEKPPPALSEIIKGNDGSWHTGWNYLIYQFLESGGLEKKQFEQRLEQYWSNGYDWTQLGLFLNDRYPGLNGAELELLWKTFCSESLSTESSVCLSEKESLKSLERIARLEILKNRELAALNTDLWFLHRSDSVALRDFSKKQSELEVLAVSIHPYYFNACHSLDQIFFAIESDDLEAFRKAARQFSQDMLDAQQLSFETDRLMERLCP